MGKAILLFITALVASLCDARTIRWTSAGANGQWDFSQNWDCSCIPTGDDDVIIDVPNIPGTVKIAANPAACKSLTVGGSSTFPQSLYIQGKLSIGAGGGVINPNGEIILDASPVAPLSSDGVFSGSSHFVFKSGTLAGRGQFIFENINFTTPASKTINATTTVKQLLWVQPGAGANALINIGASTLSVPGILRTEESLTIASDDTKSASLDVTGQLNFYGSGKQYIIRGYASVTSLNVFSGDLSIQNAVDIMNASISRTASISLIGGPENKRNFGTVFGDGSFNIQGGDNTMKSASNLGNLVLTAGKLTSDGRNSIVNLFLTGGEFAGSGSVAATSTSFSFGILTSLSLTTSSLSIAGSSTLTASTLTLTGAGKTTTNSQFTLNAGALFAIANTGSFSHANTFGLVPGADPKPPVFKNDGTWNANAALTIVVNTQGNGVFNMLQGSVLSCTGVNFQTNTMNTQTTSKFLGVTATIATLTGTGYYELDGKTYQINAANVGNLMHKNGQTAITSGTIGNLQVYNGNFNVNGKIKAGLFNFTSGTVTGTAAGAVLSATSTTISGATPKFLTTIQIVSQNINWNCNGASTCQIVSSNSVLQTGTVSVSENSVGAFDDEEFEIVEVEEEVDY